MNKSSLCYLPITIIHQVLEYLKTVAMSFCWSIQSIDSFISIEQRHIIQPPHFLYDLTMGWLAWVARNWNEDKHQLRLEFNG